MIKKGSKGKSKSLLRRNLFSNLFPKGSKHLDMFLEETKNPIFAYTLTKIALNQDEDSISVEDAIEKINNSSGIDGIIELFNHINSADVWSGGTSKGFYDVGVYEHLLEINLMTKSHYGTSIGAVPATLLALHLQEDSFGIDTSPQFSLEFATKLGDSLIDEEKTPNNITKKQLMQLKLKTLTTSLGTLYNGFMEEFIKDTAKFEKVVTDTFGDIRVSDAKGLYISVANMTKGRHVLIGMDDELNDEYIRDAIMKTSAVPHAFKPIRVGTQVYTDGGVYGFPLSEAFDSGVEFAFVTVINYHLNKLDRKGSNFRGPFGTIKQALRNYTMMNTALTEAPIRSLTGVDPEYVAEHGDPYGRMILLLPDLRHIRSFDFGGECRTLPKLGYEDSKESLEKFLDPDYKHPDYDSISFLSRYHSEMDKWTKRQKLQKKLK